MPLDIVVGAQWGDEGKGRMVDVLAAHADVVARFNGGDNAGHTVMVGERLFQLHLIPSGIVHPHTVAVLGCGMVLNPATLVEEMARLAAAGVEVTPQRLRIAYNAHLVTPGHRALDQAQEAARGQAAIGTTLRGIGPAYTDRAARQGLRAALLCDPSALSEALRVHLRAVNRVLTRLYDAEPLAVEEQVAQFQAWAARLAPFVGDVSAEVDAALRAGKRVLAEGAQGALLDLDHGTYPYVTSSTTVAAGALVGLGLGPGRFPVRVIGVVKAFQTRVGGGPFPTEVDGAVAEHLRGTGANPWDEFGTTTGRPRRVGWLDAVLLRYTARLNGLTHLAVTKLDILSGLDTLQVAVAYRYPDGTVRETLPQGPLGLERVEPVYETLPGWREPLGAVRAWEDLPAAAQRYVRRLGEWVGVPVRWVSVGPEREQLIAVPDARSVS